MATPTSPSGETPAAANPTIHASAVLIGAYAALIRGPSGAGKSRLALTLIDAAEKASLPFARLVADDRVRLDVANGRLLARAPSELAGLIEIRGLGVRHLPFETVAVVGLVIDLAASDAARLPADEAGHASVLGVSLPRLAVAPGVEPLPLLLARIKSPAGATPPGPKVAEK
jgi:HPr kinase/phosphorylase